MKRSAFSDWLWRACRSGLGFLFLLAAASKLHDPVKFMGSLENYGVVHGYAAALGALALPGVELLCGLALLLKFQVRSAGLLIAGMLLLFMGAIGWAMKNGVQMDCSCFNLTGALGGDGPEADPAAKQARTRLLLLGLSGLYLALHLLAAAPAARPGARRWRGLLIAALFAWTGFGLMGAGPEAWRPGLQAGLGLAAALWLGLDLLRGGWAELLRPAALRDALVLGPLAYAILMALGTGQSDLGWRTQFRDLAMLLPALGLALYEPSEP